MHSGNKFASIKKANDSLLARAEQCLARGEFEKAEQQAREALQNWRSAGAPRQEEAVLIATLGKSLEGSRKYEAAYDLYMEALGFLTGEAYDQVYRRFLYLNERLGTFGGKSPAGTPP